MTWYCQGTMCILCAHFTPSTWLIMAFPRHLPWSFGRKPRPCQKPNHPCISRSPGGTTTWKWWLQEVVFFFKANEASWMSPFSSFIASWNSSRVQTLQIEDQQTSQMIHWKAGLCVVLVHISKYTTVIFLALPNTMWYCTLAHETQRNSKTASNVVQLHHPWPWCWGQLNGHLGKDLSWSWHDRSWPSGKIPKKGARKVLRIVLGSLDIQVTRARHLLASRVSESNIVTQFTLHLQARQADRVFESVTNQRCRNSRWMCLNKALVTKTTMQVLIELQMVSSNLQREEEDDMPTCQRHWLASQSSYKATSGSTRSCRCR